MRLYANLILKSQLFSTALCQSISKVPEYHSFNQLASTKMSDLSELTKLVKDGFAQLAEIKEDVKDIRDELKNVKEEISSVKKTSEVNSSKLASHDEQLEEVRSQVKELIISDQDHRRMAGRRYVLFTPLFENVDCLI